MNGFAHLMVVEEGTGRYQCMVVKGKTPWMDINTSGSVKHGYNISALQ
jgi:hypothetical protein